MKFDFSLSVIVKLTTIQKIKEIKKKIPEFNKSTRENFDD